LLNQFFEALTQGFCNRFLFRAQRSDL